MHGLLKTICPPCSLAKHRIGTKRHRVCLEIPQEVSQSELFPKEELSSGQYDMTECQAALAPVRPTHSSVRPVEDGLNFPGQLVMVFSPTTLTVFCSVSDAMLSAGSQIGKRRDRSVGR